jgi:ABC-2 type transport system permease protein
MNARTTELVFGPARSILRSALIWTIAISAIVFVTVAIWPAFKDSAAVSKAFDQLPAQVVQAFGLAGIGTPAGFLRGNLYDFFIPLLMAGAAVGFANSLSSSEEDNGRLEIVLAQPVTRQSVFAGRVLAALVWILFVTVITTAVQFGSDALFDLRIGADRLLATLALSALLALFCGALAFAAAGLTGKPSAALGIGLLVAVGGAIVAALFPLSSTLAELAHVSPWDWAFAGDPLSNGADAWRYAALGVPAIALAILGTWAFGRRDVSAA